MGGRPARLSTPPVGEVRNAPMIQHAAFRCMEVRDLRTPFTFAPSKYQSLCPYVAIGSTHALYRMRLLRGERPLVELPSILIAVTVVRAFVV